MLHMALLIMKKQIKGNVILIILVSLLFMSFIILFAGIKNSMVRYEPLKQYFDKQGAFIFGAIDVDEHGGAEGYLNDLDVPEGFETAAFFEGYGQNDSGVSIKVVICKDEFIDQLNLPIMSAIGSRSGEVSVTMPYNDSIGIGETFSISSVFPGKVFRVTKLLNSFTYSPTMSRYSSSREDYSLFYETYNIDDKESNIPFVLIRESDIAECGQVFPTMGFLAYYPKNMSDGEYADFLDRLPKNQYIEFNTLRENSNAKQLNNTLKYLPICLAFALSIILGFTCCVSVFSLQDMKRMKIFYISGASGHQFLSIYLIELSIVTIFAALINVVLLILFDCYGLNSTLGLVYSFGNIILTFIIVLTYVLASSFIPLRIIYYNSVRSGR